MAVDDEKLKAEREARRKLFMDWDIEKELPADISGYKLHRIDKQDGRIYYAFGWTNEENGWEVRALFDEETMDYMVKMYLRLVTLTEIELITGDFDEFKRNLVLLTPKAIDHELIHRENVSVLVRGKGFMVWDSEPFLPETIGHYQRMIKPSMPVLGLNGSYIIGAYECREKDTGILFLCTETSTTASFAPAESRASSISMTPRRFPNWKKRSIKISRKIFMPCMKIRSLMIKHEETGGKFAPLYKM